MVRSPIKWMLITVSYLIYLSNAADPFCEQGTNGNDVSLCQANHKQDCQPICAAADCTQMCGNMCGSYGSDCCCGNIIGSASCATENAPCIIQYQYLGCFIDSGGNGTLPPALNDWIFGEGYTIQQCYEACNDKEYKYFSIQNGSHCYCDDSYNDGIRYGNTTICNNGTGGIYANDIYVNTLYSKPLYYIQAQDEGNWSVGNNVCAEQYGTFLATIVTEKDAIRAKNAVNIPNSNETVWIGLNDLDEEGIWNWSDGTTRCDIYHINTQAFNCDKLSFWKSDQPNDLKGGQDCARMNSSQGVDNLFADTECHRIGHYLCQDPGYRYIGCSNHSELQSDLDFIGKGTGFTVTSCHTICSQYNYFIFNNQSQCICGQIFNETKKHEMSMDCMNDISVVHLYRNVLEYKYIGCYSDMNGARALPIELGEGFSIIMCHQNCSNSGYRYFGIQHLHYCFCGNSLMNAIQYGSSASCVEGYGANLVNSVYENINGMFCMYCKLFQCVSQCNIAPSQSPTTSPSIEPSIDPTSDPTIHPTVYPITDATSDPTNDPTVHPITDPTMNPTIDPTVDPTIDPQTDSTFDPTIDPTFDLTMDPTADPTTNPSVSPKTDTTNDPTASSVIVIMVVVVSGTVVIVTIICLILFCRKKKHKDTVTGDTNSQNTMKQIKPLTVPPVSPMTDNNDNDEKSNSKQVELMDVDANFDRDDSNDSMYNDENNGQSADIKTAGDDVKIDLDRVGSNESMYNNENNQQLIDTKPGPDTTNGDNNNTKYVIHWSTKDLLDWIIKLENGRYEQFKDPLYAGLNDENVNGQNIQDIDEQDLRHYGIKFLSDRKNMIKHIENLISSPLYKPQQEGETIGNGDDI